MVLLVLPLAVYAFCLYFTENRVQRSLYDLFALCLRHFPLTRCIELRLKLLSGKGKLALDDAFIGLLAVLSCVFLLSNEAGDVILAEIKSNSEGNGLLDVRELGVDGQLAASLLLPLALHVWNF